jgi:ferredoxin
MKKEKKMAKIIHNKEECIGCMACVAVCPSNWEMKEGKAIPKKTEITKDDLKCNKEAAETCPVQCIKVEE